MVRLQVNDDEAQVRVEVSSIFRCGYTWRSSTCQELAKIVADVSKVFTVRETSFCVGQMIVQLLVQALPIDCCFIAIK